MSKSGVFGTVGAFLIMQGSLSVSMWLFGFDCIKALWTMLLIDGIIINIAGGGFLVIALFSKTESESESLVQEQTAESKSESESESEPEET